MDRGVSLSALLVASLLPPSVARATENEDARAAIEQCGADSESAQRQRKSGKLSSARDEFRLCARPSCPDAIANFCVGRLAETEAALPTIVVRARDAAGLDVGDLDVWIDGVVVGRSDGRSLEVDPGAHALRLQRGGTVLSKTTLVVAEGEKLRAVTLPLAPPEPERPAPPASAPSAPLSPWFYVAAGLGVASATTGFVFWASGLNARSRQLEPGGCAPQCPDAVRESIRNRILVGDGFVLLGSLSLGLAAYLLFAHRSPAER